MATNRLPMLTKELALECAELIERTPQEQRRYWVSYITSVDGTP
jgi:hypothetical protein